MDDSFADMKRELYEIMQRMRHDRIMPPTPEGVTPSEARIMMAVGKLEACGEPIRPGRVAEISHTTPSALSQTFKALEEKGLIERHRTSDDYRAVTVVLTEEGRQFAAEGRRLRDEHMNQVMAYVGEEDMAHLVRILKRVVEFHDRTHADAFPAPCGAEGDGACAPSGPDGRCATQGRADAATPAPHDSEGGNAPCA